MDPARQLTEFREGAAEKSAPSRKDGDLGIGKLSGGE